MANLTKCNKVLWIAWEKHRRTVELCNHFGIDLIAYSSISNRLVKYIVYSIKSIFNLICIRPEVLIVQNPSIALSLMMCLLKPFFRYKLFIDTHNAGIIPDNKLLQMMPWIYVYIQRSADMTIVTNKGLASLVAINNGMPFVMPDKLPDIRLPQIEARSKDKFVIVYICTFGADEPYLQLIDAAGYFSNDVIFYVTGKKNKVPHQIIQNSPSNLIYTDFLPDDEYWKLLTSADLIIDLTNRQDCLVCGAYEAVAAEVPLVLSDTKAIREYFTIGCVFTHNSTDDIVSSIKYAIKNVHSLKRDIISLKNKMQLSWLQIAEEFRNRLEKV